MKVSNNNENTIENKREEEKKHTHLFKTQKKVQIMELLLWNRGTTSTYYTTPFNH